MGLHVGHTLKKSVFLASWSFYGWRYNLFIHNMVKSLIFLKMGLKALSRVVKLKRPVWYICIKNIYMSALIVRYGFLVGEGFYSYNWIAGSVTNFKRIWGWNNLLLRIMSSEKYVSRFKDKKRLFGFLGILNTRRRIPGMGFIPRPIDDRIPVDEFLLSRVPCIGIADSNCVSSDIIIPVFGNDDSLICTNFFTFLLSKHIMLTKVNFFKMWKLKKRKTNYDILLKRKYLFFKFLLKNKKNKYKYDKINSLILDKIFIKKKKGFVTNEDKLFKNEYLNVISLSYWRYVETMIQNVNVIL